jgi:hypothetical protein
MKFNKIFIALLLLIVASSIGIACAEEASVADHKFTIPDGYKILNTTDDTVILTQDDDHVIIVIVPEEVKSDADAKTYLENQGYKFLGDETYDADGKIVQQHNYEKDGYSVMTYIIPAGSDQCIVTFTIPAGETAPEGADNPVTTVLNSIS